jgi:polysaccharide biosynthesis/export protein
MRQLILPSLVALAAMFPQSSGEAAAPSQAAQHAATTAAVAGAASVDPSAADYVIGPGDVLALSFWREQALSGEVLVRPDGKISVPLLDDIDAAGLTPIQLRDRLAALARSFVTEPVVTVIVRQINSRKVFITGLVAHPGQYPLIGSMTVLQLIATAGGLQDYARSRDIRIRRVENGRAVTVRVDYALVSRGDPSARDVELKAGDTVIIP